MVLGGLEWLLKKVFPFNKFGIVWGNPIFWDGNKTFESHSKEIQNELKRITKLSETFVN